MRFGLGLLLLAWMLPAQAEPVEFLPPEVLYAQQALAALPYPVLVPELPGEFRLMDVRVQTVAHAHYGIQHSYTLVFVSQGQSFMLQSRLAGYHQAISACDRQPLASSRPILLRGYSVEPQSLEILSPACSATGQALTRGRLEPETAARLLSSLRWYLPMGFR